MGISVLLEIPHVSRDYYIPGDFSGEEEKNERVIFEGGKRGKRAVM